MEQGLCCTSLRGPHDGFSKTVLWIRGAWEAGHVSPRTIGRAMGSKQDAPPTAGLARTHQLHATLSAPNPHPLPRSTTGVAHLRCWAPTLRPSQQMTLTLVSHKERTLLDLPPHQSGITHLCLRGTCPFCPPSFRLGPASAGGRAPPASSPRAPSFSHCAALSTFLSVCLLE